jgi:hypothetical protein
MPQGETLVELGDLPPSDPGAPSPVILADEHRLHLAYLMAGAGGCALVTFSGIYAHLFGAPNDEALHGHRLAHLGLEAYGFYRLEHSTWIADLCARNQVHPRHRDSLFDGLQHYIFTFHDSTLEVIAASYASATHEGEPEDVLRRAGRR